MDVFNVDEMVGQFFVMEGFILVEEVVYVEFDEIFMIEGFDDDIVVEIQVCVCDYLSELEVKQDEECIEFGVFDEFCLIDGVIIVMMVVLGKDDIKMMEDFVGCVVDDFVGWIECKDGEIKWFEGFLFGFDLLWVEVENMVMMVCLVVGWIIEEELVVQMVEDVVEFEVFEDEIEVVEIEEVLVGVILNG